MPRLGRAFTLFVLLLTAASSGLAATASDFYVGLLRRGIASYEAGRFDAAVRELDVAAFGLLESVDHYETAKVYAALANAKLGRDAPARVAAQRVLNAERVQHRFAHISLPAEVRTAFVALTTRLIPGAEAAALATTGPAPAPKSAQSRGTQPATETPAKPSTPPPQPPPVTSTQPPAPAPVKAEPKKAEAAKAEPAKTESPKVIEERTVPFPPQPASPAPQPRIEAPKPQISQASIPPEIAARLAAADRHLATNNIVDARVIYRQLVQTAVDRPSLLAVAEGSYRARDFETAIRAIDRVGTLNRGEDPYRFYLAVALYETGDYARAKRELAAALPHIEITDSVARYRAKIEAAAE